MLIFEKGQEGRKMSILPECDVPVSLPEEGSLRKKSLHLPQVSENDISRHYTETAKKAYGVNDGFYPLGSCTMKYNPKINEDIAALPGFKQIHPLQPEHTVQGCMEILKTAEKYLCEITGMNRMTFQPAAGAHGEFTGLLLIKAYHESRGDIKRTKIIVPDSAHGTNPASAAMVGYSVISIPSAEDGGVDLEELKKAVGEDTAGLMLTNPNTLGLFDKNILEITKIVHEAGGLNYYDGANLNAVMGMIRPGDMGFDVVHLNLHKTFSTPHGGGGPGSGPVGCKDLLAEFLPGSMVEEDKGYTFHRSASTIGQVKSFYGNFLIVVRAMTYLFMLGKEGVPEASKHAVLNANYMMAQLKDVYDMAYQGPCMHEFVMSLARLKKETGVSAMDIAKGLLDHGIHPPTMYFPLIVPEALMAEPTETESKETLDEVISVLRSLHETAMSHPEALHQAPIHTPVTRLDEVRAARNPKLKYDFSDKETDKDDTGN
ncbi:aminomethyl-transferring glycine dehydrogenase subunit GcvPB [Lacrimispora sp.]|uniref:aminomethyl-transferring glycine dehydrogenase subunit GcvPB n=1 Tax=Lacrimispora sp. TaxID=2719234 RepID=UPI0028A6EA74|nr:aminomethyl-transferring glycine dehydrogenase subunit GcvPB [Lacrimispora sp.]